MGKSKKLADAVAANKANNIEINATATMIANLLPQFIEDNDDLETLIGYIAQFRADIALDKPIPESLIVIDAFLSTLRKVLP